MRNFKYVNKIKAAVEKECPLTVSCADIVALSARDGIVMVYYFIIFLSTLIRVISTFFLNNHHVGFMLQLLFKALRKTNCIYFFLSIKFVFAFFFLMGWNWRTQLKGPHIDLKTGRKDSKMSYSNMVEELVPQHNESLVNVLSRFNSIGIDTEATVALLGLYYYSSFVFCLLLYKFSS